MLAVFTVNSTSDMVGQFGEPIVSDGNLTLRDAVAYINGTAAAPPVGFGDAWQIDRVVNPIGVNDKIVFAPSLGGQTIGVTNGQIAISKPVTIDAAGLTQKLSIDAQNNSRIFQIQDTLVTIDGKSAGFAFKNGFDQFGGGAILSSSSILAISGCEFTGNQTHNVGPGAPLVAPDGTSNFGGAIYADVGVYNATYAAYSQLTIDHCRFYGNVASAGGGAVAVWETGGGDTNNAPGTPIDLLIRDSVFAGNESLGWYGGGLYVYRGGVNGVLHPNYGDGGVNDGANVVIERTEFSANTAALDGGGIFLFDSSHGASAGDVRLSECSFRGNTAGGSGGGLFVYSYFALEPIRILN